MYHHILIHSVKYIYTMEFYAAERKKELLPFETVWMGLESIMLSEISQEVRDKYHMISPLTGTWSTKQTNKQNITKDTEIENKLTVRGERISGEKGEGFVGTIMKDTWTITKGGWKQGREMESAGVLGWGGEKSQKTVLEQQ